MVEKDPFLTKNEFKSCVQHIDKNKIKIFKLQPKTFVIGLDYLLALPSRETYSIEQSPSGRCIKPRWGEGRHYCHIVVALLSLNIYNKTKKGT